MRIVNVVEAERSVVAIAPVIREMRRRHGLTPVLVDTGEEGERGASASSLKDLGLAPPDFSLRVGAGSHAVQTAEVMRRLESILDSIAPDLVLVLGDSNSTLAAALTAVKLGIPVAHVEARPRRVERRAPEEVNRRVTNGIAEFVFVTEARGRRHLLREGVAAEQIHVVGSLMRDALDAVRTRCQAGAVFERLQLDADQPYVVLTLERVSNGDDPMGLLALLDAVRELARHVPVVFPLQPRLKHQLLRQGYLCRTLPETGKPITDKGVAYLDPLGYLDAISLMNRARLVLTDSGCKQEETAILGVPCLLLRESTEAPRPGVIGTDPAGIVEPALRVLGDRPKRNGAPALSDGRPSERIVQILAGTEERRHAA